MATKEIDSAAIVDTKNRVGGPNPINGNGDYTADSIKVLGGMEALAAATVLAPVASSGKTDAFNGWLERKYGADTVLGMVGHERRAGRVGAPGAGWMPAAPPPAKFRPG